MRQRDMNSCKQCALSRQQMFKRGSAHIPYCTYIHMCLCVFVVACKQRWHFACKRVVRKKKKKYEKCVQQQKEHTFICFRLGRRQVGSVIYVLHTLLIRPVWHLVNAIVLLEIVATLKYLAQRWIVCTCANYVRAFEKARLHWEKNVVCSSFTFK